jgi:hypothetical protein
MMQMGMITEMIDDTMDNMNQDIDVGENEAVKIYFINKLLKSIS